MGYKNPVSAAMPYLQQVPGEAHSSFDPYIQSGQQAGGTLSSQYGSMASNPDAFFNAIMSGYQPSAAYQANKAQTLNSMENSQAAGGVAGDPYSQYQQGQAANELMAKDEQQYYNNIMQILTGGLHGEQNLYNTGFQGSSRLADILTSNLNSEGSLAFQGQRQSNQRHADIMRSILQSAGFGLEYFSGPRNFSKGGGGGSSGGGSPASSLGGAAAMAAMFA